MPADADNRRGGWLAGPAGILVLTALLAAGLSLLSFRSPLNSEMVMPFLTRPAEVVDPDALPSAGLPAPAMVELTRQDHRPRLSIRVGDRVLPLLVSPYISGITYWPSILAGIALPGVLDSWLVLPGLVLIAFGLAMLAGFVARAVGPAFWPAAGICLLLYPQVFVYATPYLYEMAPPALAVLFLWSLDSWNRTGTIRHAWLAAIFFGLCIHVKLTGGILVVSVLIACWATCGVRRPRFPLAGGLVAAACLPIGMLVLFNYWHDPTFSLFIDALQKGGLAATGEIGGSRRLALFFGRLYVFLGTGPPSAAGMASVIGTAVAMLVYSVAIAVMSWRGRAIHPVKSLFCLLFLLLLPVYYAAYRSNPQASPVLQVLPFMMVVNGLFVTDLLSLMNRMTDRTVRRLVVRAGILALLALSGLPRWAAFLETLDAGSVYLSRGSQEGMADLLDKRGIPAPFMRSDYFQGVFDFLTDGRVRPVSVIRANRLPMDEAAWLKILEGREASAFLFVRECDRRLDETCRNDPGGRHAFLDAASRSGRRFERLDLPSDGADGSPVFELFLPGRPGS